MTTEIPATEPPPDEETGERLLAACSPDGRRLLRNVPDRDLRFLCIRWDKEATPGRPHGHAHVTRRFDLLSWCRANDLGELAAAIEKHPPRAGVILAVVLGPDGPDLLAVDLARRPVR